MKKFLYKALALLLLTALPLYLGGLAYKSSVGYQNISRGEGTDTFASMPESIDVAVFGASHGRVDFQTFPQGVPAFNFALSSQTPQYDLRMLEAYQDRLHPGSTVILAVSYLCPYWNDSPEDFAAKQPRYYRVLPPWEIVDADWGKALLGGFSPLLTTELSAVLSALRETELGPSYDERGRERQLSAEDLPSEQARIQRKHVPIISPSFPGGNPVMLEAYRGILSLCAEKGWQAVLVTPPVTAAYIDGLTGDGRLPAGFYGDFRALVEALSGEYGVPWLDYSRDPRFAERLELFKDIDHLNAAGEQAFSAIFWADLAARTAP